MLNARGGRAMLLNVLIVDDSAVMRAMILRTLQMSGIPLGEVHEAEDGREGLDTLIAHPVHLGMVDINMPVMDGEEMIRRAREDPDLRDVPLLVVSTEGSQTRISRIVRRGVRFVHKPFTPEVLRDVVTELVGELVNEQLETTLLQVTEETCELLAFMFPVSPPDNVQDGSEEVSCVQVGFSGLFDGSLALAMPSGMLRALAANMLGLDPPATNPRQREDAAKELCNVVCGNLLPAIAGAQPVFAVSAPRICVAEEISCNGAVVVRAWLSEGWIEARLVIETLPQRVAAGSVAGQDAGAIS